MDRIIEVKVCGSHLTKDSNKAGTKGESNMTKLRITFDANWEDYAKSVFFWDAYGQNPVKIVLGVNLIEDISKSTRVYLVPIPAEAMARAGLLTFSIKGSLGNKNQVSITSTLEVNDSPDILDPLEPTPSELEQIQAEIDSIKDDLLDLETTRRESAENAELAKERAEIAVAAVGKSSYIGDNGNWYAWDKENSEFYDTGVKAQAGSTVFFGSTPPDDADVWINPSENNVLYIRKENGNFTPIRTIAGKDGKSAYDIAVESGYKGTLEQFTTLLNNLVCSIEADHLSDTNNPHNVTAQQVGALTITGGTLTGKTLYFDNGNSCLSGGQGYMLMDVYGAPKDNNNFRRMEVRGGATALNGALVLKERINGVDKTYIIYGSHNKPSASDIGAVPATGGTMTGPLVIDKDSSWGQLVFNTPSGCYRAFEADDSRVRIDVRDEQDTSKRRYIDIFTNTADSRFSHAFRFGQTKDGSTTAAYILHSENINDFVISNGSYIGNGNKEKTIPIRKTTKMVIIQEKDTAVNNAFAILTKGVTRAVSNIGGSASRYCDVIWTDDSVTISDSMLNQVSNTYFYTII